MNVETFILFIACKLILKQMALKCTKSGLKLNHLAIAYQRGKKQGVCDVLTENVNGKPRVSNNKKVLDKIC